MANRSKMIAGEIPLDWGCAETLAYAALLRMATRFGSLVRTSVGGTFFHRHSVLHEQQTGATWIPLQHVLERQPRVQIIDSVLSEESGDGIRVRIRDDRTQLPVDLGRSIRRLREWCPGHHRSVHQLGRSEVGSALRFDAVPAARL